jgi:hypothetical protein
MYRAKSTTRFPRPPDAGLIQASLGLLSQLLANIIDDDKWMTDEWVKG